MPHAAPVKWRQSKRSVGVRLSSRWPACKHSGKFSSDSAAPIRTISPTPSGAHVGRLPAAARGGAGGSAMKCLSVIALGLAMLLPAVLTADEKKDEKAAKLVGTWELTKSDDAGAPVGATITFTKDGKLSVAAKVNDMDLKFEGTYKVEGDKLITEIKIGDMSMSDTDTIKKLTDDEMELVNKDGKATTLKKKKAK